jgi:hypothetical protein
VHLLTRCLMVVGCVRLWTQAGERMAQRVFLRAVLRWATAATRRSAPENHKQSIRPTAVARFGS